MKEGDTVSIKFYPNEVTLCKEDHALLEEIRDLMKSSKLGRNDIPVNKADANDLVDVNKEIGATNPTRTVDDGDVL